LKAVINRWQRFKRDEGFWNAVYIQNHDRARCISRFGNDSDQWRWMSAKVLAMLEIAQTGTLYVYQGEEIGMKNLPQDWGIEEYQDVATVNYYNRCVPMFHLRKHRVRPSSQNEERARGWVSRHRSRHGGCYGWH
jgi:glycosidase